MDQEAFRSFYNQTMPALRSYVIRGCGTVEAADDIVQEAFLRFLRSAPAALSDSQRRAYLYRTVENLIVNRWRSTQREQTFTAPEAANTIRTPSLEVTSDVERALAQLDPRQRMLLWLAYVEGFDHKEIAGIANLNAKSVRVLLFRARQKFMGILKRAGLGSEVL